MKINWRSAHGVVIDESRKIQWVEDILKEMDLLEEGAVRGIQSGDCYISVEKAGYGFNIYEFKPVRHATIMNKDIAP